MQELIVVSDIHLARVWDRISKLDPDFFNPNSEFRNLVEKIRPKQGLIVNGDMIDYFFSDRSETSENNWDLFKEIISKCQGKYLLNPGNHDYRYYPYNLNIYGFGQTNLAKKNLRKAYKSLGFSNFKWLGELKALFINTKKYDPLKKGLKEYYLESSSWADLVFLNTGPDAFNYLLNFLKTFHWWPLLNFMKPASRGLSDQQINFLASSLNNSGFRKEKIIFLHCPPFSHKKNIKPAILKEKSYLNYNVKCNSYEATFFDNNWNFISALMKSKQNILVVTSHTHGEEQHIIDKKTGLLKCSDLQEINELRKDNRYIKFVSTLPLGIIRYKRKGRQTGYLLINEDNIKYEVIKDFLKSDKKNNQKSTRIKG